VATSMTERTFMEVAASLSLLAMTKGGNDKGRIHSASASKPYPVSSGAV
jgi:hypothetical protein